jgi:uncharacterized protein YvpB
VFTISDLTGDTVMTGDGLLAALEAGPAVLLHLCAEFPYGNQWAPRSEGAHAVMITGIDTDNNYVTFNNPWGDKDQSCDLAMLLDKINADAGMGKTFGFWRG